MNGKRVAIATGILGLASSLLVACSTASQNNRVAYVLFLAIGRQGSGDYCGGDN